MEFKFCSRQLTQQQCVESSVTFFYIFLILNSYALIMQAEAKATISGNPQIVCDRYLVDATWGSAGVPKAHIQASARNQRYNLLLQAAKTNGCAAILTGHHLDDQIETMFMRLSSFSTVAGLPGIRDSRILHSTSLGYYDQTSQTKSLSDNENYSQIHIVRPLLKWRKERLAKTCIAHILEIVSDK